MSAAVENFLSRLQKVKRTAPSSWVACCPAHEDKSPSLSVSEGREGVVLVKCWAGCKLQEIVASVGLKVADMFPEPMPHDVDYRPAIRRPFNPYDVLTGLAGELMVIVVGMSDAIAGAVPQGEDLKRYRLAMDRILTGIELGTGRAFTSAERRELLASSRLREKEQQEIEAFNG